MYAKVQCIVASGHMGIPLPHPRGETDTTENFTFPKLRWRAVKNRNKVYSLIVVKTRFPLIYSIDYVILVRTVRREANWIADIPLFFWCIP